jgi:hypothetical protein
VGIPTSQADFDAGVEEITPKIGEVETKIDECQAKVRDIDWPSGWERLGQGLITALFPIAGFYFGAKDIERLIADQPAVQAMLEQAAEGAADIAEEVAQLLSPGNPFALKMMANEWDNINTVLTGVVGSLGDDKFYATASWQDGMGRYYANVPAGQRAALEGLVPHVENMRTYLREHSDNIIRLWWDLYEEVVSFVIDAIPLASKFISANPIKWLDMAEPIADCIARVLEAVQNIVSLIFEFGMASNSNLESFRASASNTAGTDFGKWPVARLS